MTKTTPKICRYLTFTLGIETFGIDILLVQDIVQLVPITRMPRVAPYLLGLINLRGKVVPVIDLRLRFGMEDGKDKVNLKRAGIIVVQVDCGHGPLSFGLKVDTVCDVLESETESIKARPDKNQGMIDSEFMSGVVLREGGRLVILLDIIKVVTDSSLDGD